MELHVTGHDFSIVVDFGECACEVHVESVAIDCDYVFECFLEVPANAF